MKKPAAIARGGLLGLACPCSIAAARPRALLPNMQLVQQESLPYVQASSRNILCGLHGLRICSCAPLLIEARPSSIAIFSAALHRTLRALHPHLSGRLTSSPVCLDSVCAPCEMPQFLRQPLHSLACLWRLLLCVCEFHRNQARAPGLYSPWRLVAWHAPSSHCRMPPRRHR